MAAHRDPQRVLVVGLGMGTTFIACRMHAARTLRVVELEEAVVRAAAWLDVRPADLVVADARSYLRATEERFDVITSDPIHPWVRGGGDLYTREYFESCRARLAPGGVVCQWLPTHHLAVEDLRDIVRTFCATFPAAGAYYAGGDLVLLGAGEGPMPEPRRLTGPAGDAVAALGVADLAGLRVADRARLVADAGEGPLVTDDSLRLEFRAPKRIEEDLYGRCLAWIGDLWHDPPFPYGPALLAEEQRALGEYDLMWDVLEVALGFAPEDPLLVRQVGELNLYDAGIAASRGLLDRALEIFRVAELHLPGDPRLPGVEADLRIARGETVRARELLTEMLRAAPDSAWLRRRIAALDRAGTGGR
jgi:hypothetical protein